ncbi:uncharacterized protein L969DRAFT_94087 [Mixia osmundae IAM 14324]|uniref:Uncharacterized protein n=1 Tax=Mixia osmundae (strain CBS 9802 / IAM 14324 / JCM 22182 / KY 12970) TaxID=764103 RepID=G7E919_MIXOS|nr:uncharacterized protein L969DRAFT_94087 [Mixia osmundae IAM 14324]KEI40273.1 hypothetical protein L969DRAFT_94087 [Mixia osmundae IAM 14324]GAA99637.1 hypothetical protein E5Q_06338 [Mixia osmundae IAM 14324]
MTISAQFPPLSVQNIAPSRRLINVLHQEHLQAQRYLRWPRLIVLNGVSILDIALIGTALKAKLDGDDDVAVGESVGVHTSILDITIALVALIATCTIASGIMGVLTVLTLFLMQKKETPRSAFLKWGSLAIANVGVLVMSAVVTWMTYTRGGNVESSEIIPISIVPAASPLLGIHLKYKDQNNVPVSTLCIPEYALAAPPRQMERTFAMGIMEKSRFSSSGSRKLRNGPSVPRRTTIFCATGVLAVFPLIFAPVGISRLARSGQDIAILFPQGTTASTSLSASAAALAIVSALILILSIVSAIAIRRRKFAPLLKIGEALGTLYILSGISELAASIALVVVLSSGRATVKNDDIPQAELQGIVELDERLGIIDLSLSHQPLLIVLAISGFLVVVMTAASVATVRFAYKDARVRREQEEYRRRTRLTKQTSPQTFSQLPYVINDGKSYVAPSVPPMPYQYQQINPRPTSTRQRSMAMPEQARSNKTISSHDSVYKDQSAFAI